MIDLLKDYIADSLQGCERKNIPDIRLRAFETNQNLAQKVERRSLKPFYGNTIVFALDDAQKKLLSQYQKELYRVAGWMLADPLEQDTFHMTLHDLVNGPELTQELADRIEEARIEAEPLIQLWRSGPDLPMETTWLFNMVNTSVVIGLAPKDQETRERLSWMYRELNRIVPLGHKLTPHITMAYYAPGVYTSYDLNCLRFAFREVKEDITLKMENLVLQNFTDMNSYHTVF